MIEVTMATHGRVISVDVMSLISIDYGSGLRTDGNESYL